MASAVNKELNKQLSSFKKQLLGLRVIRSYPLKVIQPHCESGIGRSSRFGAKKKKIVHTTFLQLRAA